MFLYNSPKELGHRNGRLKDCPVSPNCVSSQAPTQDSHFIEPIGFSGDSEEALAQMRASISELSGCQVLRSEGHYLHAVCVTKLMRFRDDLELYLNEDEKVFHVRSASRLGWGDHNVNRKRVEQLRSIFRAKIQT